MKFKHLFIGLFACAICAANFVFGVSTPNGSSDLTLQNIEAVGLSAAESKCENRNSTVCYTYNGDKLVPSEDHGPFVTSE